MFRMAGEIFRYLCYVGEGAVWFFGDGDLGCGSGGICFAGRQNIVPNEAGGSDNLGPLDTRLQDISFVFECERRVSKEDRGSGVALKDSLGRKYGGKFIPLADYLRERISDFEK